MGSTSGPQSLHITPIAAHVLSQLLLQGGPLLAPCIPPPAPMLEAMRLSSGGASSPKGSELLALEAAVGELLRLIPAIASSAKSFTHELPFEEFLFFVSILILEPFGPIFVSSHMPSPPLQPLTSSGSGFQWAHPCCTAGWLRGICPARRSRAGMVFAIQC